MDNPKFNSLLVRMREIHARKNADYSHGSPYSNFEEAAIASGTTVSQVFRTLIGIKLARLTALEKQGTAPQNESIQDTYLDLAVYAALMASYFLDAPVKKMPVLDTFPQVGGTVGHGPYPTPRITGVSLADQRVRAQENQRNIAEDYRAGCVEDRYLSKRGVGPLSLQDSYEDSQKRR